MTRQERIEAIRMAWPKVPAPSYFRADILFLLEEIDELNDILVEEGIIIGT